MTTMPDHRLTTAALDFDSLAARVEDVLESPSSARVYRETFSRWHVWATANGVDPLALNFRTVGAYLADRDVAKSTKQRELSALRTLARMLKVLDYTNAERTAAYESLRMLKVQATKTQNGDEGHTVRPEHQRRALSPADADRMLRVWSGDTSRKGKRNHALVAVALLSGLRAAELAALRWSDIDLDAGIINVAHGKGDKQRDVALYGQVAQDALKAWRAELPRDYVHVFVGFRGRGAALLGDAPMATKNIWQTIVDTAQAAGIGHVKPHDLRRTLATELLEMGAPVHHVQQQLGHANAQTTLQNYTGKVDAGQRRRAGRVRYG